MILTAVTDRDTRVRAVELGATDFLNKPVDASELVPRVRNVLVVKGYQDQLRQYNNNLEVAVRQRTAELENSRRDLIHCLARAAEYRDDDTGQHVLRVGRYTRLDRSGPRPTGRAHRDARAGRTAPRHRQDRHSRLRAAQAGQAQRRRVRHDAKAPGFGKRILTSYSTDEEKTLQRHAEVGAHILEVGSSKILDMARTIALTHHERWDGSGYPLGLKSNDIPLVGRITAVADVFDALSSRRSYKKAFPLDECFQIMTRVARLALRPRSARRLPQRARPGRAGAALLRGRELGICHTLAKV